MSATPVRLAMVGVLSVAASLALAFAPGAPPAASTQAAVKLPDPARFAKAIEDFVTWDRKNSSPRDAVLFVGSSSIVLWPTREAFPDRPVINRGFGGSHMSELNHYFDQVVKPYDAAAIVVYEGDNDIQDGLPPDLVRDHYAEFIRRVRATQPRTPVVLLSTKPSASRWDKWPRVQELNAMLRALAEKNEHVHYVDLATPLLGADGQPDPAFYLEDKLHLSSAGYAVWNKTLAPVLGAVSKKP